MVLSSRKEDNSLSRHIVGEIVSEKDEILDTKYN